MPSRGYGIGAAAAGGALAVLLVAGGCGQLTVGEGAGTASSGPSSSSPAPSATGVTPTPDGSGSPGTADPPVPGPGAPAACADLVGPLYRLVTGEGDTAATAEEVRRLADGADDNALAAVARRLSALVAQPAPDVVARSAEWDQVRQICDLG